MKLFAQAPPRPAARASLAIVAILSLFVALLALATPAFADHPGAGGSVTSGSGNPTCSDFLTGTSEIKESPASGDLATSDSPASDGTVTISYTVSGKLLDFTVDTAGYVVLGVVVKGGNNSGYNFYDYRPTGVTSGSDLHTVYNNNSLGGLSHVSFCYRAAGGGGTTPPTNGGGTTPPTNGGGTTPPGGTGGVLGSTGRPAAGGLPNTATDGGALLTALSAILLAASAGTLTFSRLARRSR